MVLSLIQDCPFPEALCSDSSGLDCSLVFLWPSSKDRLFWFMLFPSLSNSSSQLESRTLCKSSTRIKINRVWISLPCSLTTPWLGRAHRFSQPPTLFSLCLFKCFMDVLGFYEFIIFISLCPSRLASIESFWLVLLLLWLSKIDIFIYDFSLKSARLNISL